MSHAGDEQGGGTEPQDQLGAKVNSLICGTFGWRRLPNHGITDLELIAAEEQLGARLPRSYRAFLRYFGSRAIPGSDLFGLPRDGLGHDIVLVNEVTRSDRPLHLILFATNDEHHFYFDTRRRNRCGECPVVVRDRSGFQREFARSFLHFLKKMASSRTGPTQMQAQREKVADVPARIRLAR